VTIQVYQMYGLSVRRHGWAGDLPASDEEAIQRILRATRTCIDRDGPGVGIVDVARELGVTRQTVYRYYRTTDDLLTATAMDASAAFLAGLESHLTGREWSPAEAVVEGIAFTLEQLPHEPYLGLLLTPGRIGVVSRDFTSDTAMAMGRTMIERFPIDWTANGFDGHDLDELVEQMLRTTQSFVVDPGTPPRTGAALRDYLSRWLGPALIRRSEEARVP
jgi:AcrR family transcriptional regulator